MKTSPTPKKIRTVRNAKLNREGFRWVFTDADGSRMASIWKPYPEINGSRWWDCGRYITIRKAKSPVKSWRQSLRRIVK